MPSKIEWTDETWNPVTGCTPISPGCDHCYAERMAKRLAGRYGYPKDEPFKVTCHEDKMNEPFGWKKPKRVFVCSMGDLFHPDVEPWQQYRIFKNAYDLRNRHTFIFLTKRPIRMLRFITGSFPPNPFLPMSGNSTLTGFTGSSSEARPALEPDPCTRIGSDR